MIKILNDKYGTDFNDVYKKYFPENPPARTTIQAGKLPLDVQIEIDAIVALPLKDID
ncbi:MAG: hypothetical protein C4560_01185 [Nitrospiraceae bacterium]|nr:MAG: hypothetical protein C4560_01185 [Nitrospiraceae bacterium]